MRHFHYFDIFADIAIDIIAAFSHAFAISLIIATPFSFRRHAAFAAIILIFS